MCQLTRKAHGTKSQKGKKKKEKANSDKIKLLKTIMQMIKQQ